MRSRPVRLRMAHGVVGRLGRGRPQLWFKVRSGGAWRWLEKSGNHFVVGGDAGESPPVCRMWFSQKHPGGSLLPFHLVNRDDSAVDGVLRAEGFPAHVSRRFLRTTWARAADSPPSIK